MAAQDSQPLAASATPASPQHQAAMTAPPSPQGQGAPGSAMPPQQAGPVAAPPSPQGPPGFWVAPQQGAPLAAPAPRHGAPMMAPQQQHFAPVMVPGSEQGTMMPVEAASMGMMAPMPLQAPAMAALQPPQGMARLPSLPMAMGLMPTMEMQQAQAGHMMAPPPLPLGPPSAMLLQQQPPQADPVMKAQPPLPLVPPAPPAMLPQQPQAGPVVTAQPPLPLGPPPVMLQQPSQADHMLMAQPHLSAPPCKRQCLDQYDMPYGQHMTGHQREMALFNALMGQSYGPYLHNELPSFGAPEPSLPPDASSTLYIEGLPSNCTRREVAHIFRQYMGFREVRLANKGSSRHVMCFVDFSTPAQAFLAMQTLQGYKFDQQDHRSTNLHLQFSHSPRVGSHGGR